MQSPAEETFRSRQTVDKHVRITFNTACFEPCMPPGAEGMKLTNDSSNFLDFSHSWDHGKRILDKDAHDGLPRVQIFRDEARRATFGS
jgi:hypothetical protein